MQAGYDLWEAQKTRHKFHIETQYGEIDAILQAPTRTPDGIGRIREILVV